MRCLLFIFLFSLFGLNLGTQKFDISPYKTITMDYEIELIKDIAIYYGQDYELIKSIFDICEQYDSDPLLLISLIKIESDFVANAVSVSNAIGYCQIKSVALKDIGYDLDKYDPMENIMIGTIFLSKLIRIYDNDVREALIHYNAGTRASIRHKGIIYADNVLNEYANIKMLEEKYY